MAWWQTTTSNNKPAQAQDGGLKWWQSQPAQTQAQDPEADDFAIKPPEKPFMAQAVDNYGLPYYGKGLQGWARGTFAKIFDPKHQLGNIEDAEIRNRAQSAGEINKYAEEFNDLTRWDEWGGKLFGVTSKDFGAIKAAASAEVEDARLQGESAAGTIISGLAGQARRGIGQIAMSGLGLFGAVDVAKRKLIMTRQANYELAQDSDLYLAAKEGGAPEWLLSRGPEWEVGKVDGGFVAENPILGMFSDPLKPLRSAFQFASAFFDQDTRAQLLPTYKQYWQGSGMAYTMVSDAQKRQLFIDAVNRGEDPGLAASNYGNMWTELAGSILNDPTTYLGVGILGKGKSVVKIPFIKKAITIGGKPLTVPWQKIGSIPTLGELLGIGGKAARTSAALKAVSAVPEVADEVVRMEKAGDLLKPFANLSNETQATEQMTEAFGKIADGIKTWDQNLTAGKLPNLRAAITASNKANQMTRNMTNAIRLVVGSGGDVDEVLENMVNIKKMFSPSRAEAMQSTAIVMKKYGQLGVSDQFLQLGKFLDHFENDDDILKLINTSAGNPSVLADPVFKKIQAFSEAFYPSMDEMADAVAKLKDKAGDVAKAQDEIARLEKLGDSKELKKAKSAYEAAFGKQQGLARAYEGLSPIMRTGRATLRKYEQVFFRPMKKYMDTVFLALRPAQYMRQLQSQTALIAMDLGFVDAIEIAARTAVTSFSEGWTAQMVQRNSDEIKKLLGFVPESMARGVTAAGEVKGAGFLRVSGNLDTLMSGEITLRVAQRELNKVLANSDNMFDYKALGAVFNGDEINMLKTVLRENGGDVKAAVASLASKAADGKIEAWRHVPLPNTLRDFAQDTKLYDELLLARNTATTRADFLSKVDDLIGRATDQARRAAAADLPVVDEATHETIREIFLEAQELASQGKISEATQRIFNETTNAYEYMRRNIEWAGKSFRNAIEVSLRDVNVLGNPEYRAAIDELDKAQALIHNIYPDFEKVKSPVLNVLKEQKNLSSLERAQKLDNALFDVTAHTGLSIEELGALDAKQFESKVWDAYFDWSRQYWKQGNTAALSRQVVAMENLAQSVGFTAEEIMARSGELRDYMTQARKYQVEAMAWENRIKFVGDDLLQVANAYGVPTATPKGVPLNKAILNILNKNLPEGTKPFTDFKDAQARMDEARTALYQWSNAEGREGDAAQAIGKIDEFLSKKDIRDIPPVSHVGTATGAQNMYGQLTDNNFLNEVAAWKSAVTDKWGVLQDSGRFDDVKKAAITRFADDASQKMNVVRAKTAAFATAQRDDLLLSYDKNYGDLALAYLKPYHYWQTRQYIKTFARFVDHPSWANGYLKYKEAMSKEHSDLPEWWRYNIPINGLPGIKFDHPYYLNLESAINPIYDLTGADFNDPYKRVDWLSRTVDDLGKDGGSFMPGIQWLVAMNLYRKGEDDAASRWMNRLFGQAGMAAKSALTLAGADINLGKFVQHNELDPFVNFLSGGMDPNERKRVGRTMAQMVEQGLSPEQALDAMRMQSGDLYEQARQASVANRAPAELQSFFLGVNFKPRTQQDMQIDKFYQEYGQLRGQASMMSPDAYRQAWDALRERYQYMDALLLSGKQTPDRDTAYTYNVLGRLPPGQATEIYAAAGIDNDLAARFYDDKGDMSTWNAGDKERFMAGVIDMGAMLKIPPYSSKQDWNAARSGYQDVQKAITAIFGNDIDEVEDYYWSLDDKARKDFMETNPQLQQAMDKRNEFIVSNPLLYEYYGGINVLERYYKSQVYAELAKTYGEGISETQDEYYRLRLIDPAGAKRFKRAHPELASYTKDKQKLMNIALRALVEFGSQLPEAERPRLTGNQPANEQQQAIQQYATQQAPPFSYWAAELPEVAQIVETTWSAGMDIPYAVRSELDYRAGQYGFESGDDLLQAILLSMGQPAQP